jgi:Protein of unknown function (DUF669)
MAGPLNLSDADMKGFDPLEAGRYNAEVFELGMDAVKNASGEGKMPAGTPMLKCQFKITDEEYENRRVFLTYVIPPKDYDKSKAAKMKGMIARFFIALGTPEEEVLSKDFDPDFDDYLGVPCVVTLGKEPKKDRQGNVIEGEYNNPVKSVKPAGSLVAGSESVL